MASSAKFTLFNETCLGLRLGFTNADTEGTSNIEPVILLPIHPDIIPTFPSTCTSLLLEIGSEIAHGDLNDRILDITLTRITTACPNISNISVHIYTSEEYSIYDHRTTVDRVVRYSLSLFEFVFHDLNSGARWNIVASPRLGTDTSYDDTGAEFETIPFDELDYDDDCLRLKTFANLESTPPSFLLMSLEKTEDAIKWLIAYIDKNHRLISVSSVIEGQ